MVKHNYFYGASGNSAIYFRNNGLYLFNVANGTVFDNTVSNNDGNGIYLDETKNKYIISENIVQSHPYYGIYLRDTDPTNIVNNVVEDNARGISILRCHESLISDNTATGNTHGIHIASSDNSIVKGNVVSSSTNTGIRLLVSSGITVYHNSIIGNAVQAYDSGSSNWNAPYPYGGNYWDDYDGKDRGDGIGDIPHEHIMGGTNRDNYPWVRENGWIPVTMELNLNADVNAGGWNFVSFNLIPTDSSLESILEDPEYGISGNYDRVMFYNASSGTWSSYVPGRADHFNNLDNWDHTMGIWIRMTTDDTLTIQGYMPTRTRITIYPGWNMVGLPSTIYGNHGLPEEVSRIGYYDPLEEYNIAYDYDPTNFVFNPGNGYWLFNCKEHEAYWKIEY